jgi:hypothetical protein
MSPSKIMLFYLTRKVAASRIFNPIVMGSTIGVGAGVGAHAAGENLPAAISDAVTLGMIGGSAFSRGTKRKLFGGDAGQARRDLQAGNLANSSVWKHNPVTGKREFTFFDDELNAQRSVAHDSPGVIDVLKDKSSAITNRAIMRDLVANKLGLTALTAGARGAVELAGVTGDIKAVTGEAKNQLTGDKGLLADTSAKVRNVTNRADKAVGNLERGVDSAVKNTEQAGKDIVSVTGNAAAASKSLPDILTNTNKAIDNLGAVGPAAAALPTAIDSLGKNVNKGLQSTAGSMDSLAKSTERVTNFLTDPKNYAIAGAGIATLGLGYILYKALTDKEDEAPTQKAPRAPRSAGPRTKYAPADHSHPEFKPA